MNKQYEVKRIFMFWAAAVFIGLQTYMFSYLWYNYYTEWIKRGYERGNWVICLIYAVFVYVAQKISGGLKVGYLRNFDVIASNIFAILAQNFITHLELCLIGHWKFTEYLKPMIYLTLAEIVLSVIWVIVVRFLYAKVYPPHQMLLIYSEEHDPDLLMEKLGTRKDRYQIKETINLSEGMDMIYTRMKAYDTILIGDIPSKERNDFLKHCYWNNIRCYSIPKISDILMTGTTRIDLFDTQLYLSRNSGLTLFQRFVKRLMDIVISGIGIIVASPIMAIIALCVRGYDGGPAIYSQERLTKDGKPFRIYKFRSMIVESEKNGARLAKQNDDRITPVGKVIRRLHFDELPQLFNVFLGQMSFVGPRPERQEIFNQYEKSIPEFKYRLKMKAGLTGYAQVFGKYDTVPYDKLKLDLTYIEQYSLWLDIKIIFLTVKILFQKEKSEGVENTKTTALK